MPETSQDGLVIVDKPSEWTSHDVVARVRRLAGTRRVGHAGTLDPMATGVLVLGVDRATRLLTWFVGADKEYTATIRLGASTLTDDAQGETLTAPGALFTDVVVHPAPTGQAPGPRPVDGPDAGPGGKDATGTVIRARAAANSGTPDRGEAQEEPPAPSDADAHDGYGPTRPVPLLPLAGGPVKVSGARLRAAVRNLTGPIMQVPSAVSAIKVDGRRAYARVRAGQEVRLAARPVQVERFDLLRITPGEADGVPVVDVEVQVTCSSGTYVRALARDLGAALGCGGHLTALCRTRVGPFDLTFARTLEELAESFAVIPMAQVAAARFVTRRVTAPEAQALGHGRRIGWDASNHPLPGEPVAALGPDGRLVALLERDGSQARPVLVLV